MLYLAYLLKVCRSTSEHNERGQMKRLFLLTVLALWIASPSVAVPMNQGSHAVPPEDKIFGVMDDNPVAGGAAQIGFNVVKRSIWIAPTNNAWDNPSNNPRVVPLPDAYRAAIANTMEDAKTNGVSVIIELYPIIKFGAPRNQSQMRGTCDVAKDIVDRWPDTVKAVEVSVEPNSYTFNHLQFFPDGTQASAAETLKWTGICWDVIKKAHPDTLIIGGSLASRGEDDPHKPESSTSPVLFLQKFCEAYKQSGRTRPVMNIFDMHFYVDPEDQDPSVQHPAPSTTITIADGDKLESLLACFDGTAQPRPPVWWGEGGYNTDITPSQIKRFGYIGKKSLNVKVIDEVTQGQYAYDVIQMAYCQPYSIGAAWFHLVDDPDMKHDWQSGFAYTNRKQSRSSSSARLTFNYKQSVPAVRKALAAVSDGTMKCGPPGTP
jgi:hypothetical protein